MTLFGDKLRQNAQVHLHPGEEIEAAFLANRANPFTGPLGSLMGMSAVVVTDRRILEFKSSASTKLGKLERELPRSTRFERRKAAMQARIDVGGKKRWVQRGWWPEVDQSDALAR